MVHNDSFYSLTPVNITIKPVNQKYQTFSSGALDVISRDFRVFCTLSAAAVLHHFAA